MGRKTRLSPVSLADLVRDYPRLEEPIIDGLLRRGETANIIAAPKVGKSWLAYGLALHVAMGWDWLGRFHCRQGRVLLIDNELHPSTLASRLPWTAKALGLDPGDYQHSIDVLSLRGRLMDLHGIAYTCDRLEAGAYELVILDAWYRALPAGASENDNAVVAGLYNVIDGTTARMKSAWVNIHHASKGSQTDKIVTDVGAGAGSQSRAADAHIVLRPHEDEGCVVLEAVVRSFPPVDPIALRWEYPLWLPANDLDPTALKGKLTRQEERASQRDKDGIDAILDALAGGPLTAKRLRDRTGISKERIDRLLYSLESDGEIVSTTIKVRGNECKEYALPPSDGVVDYDRPRGTE